MCGIAGWIGSAAGLPARPGLAAMMAALAHRGPDGSGEHHASFAGGACRVALGHRRLAIIDPAGSPQPMSTADGALTLIYNGEIYNFRELRRDLEAAGAVFRTAGDSEVILNGYRVWGDRVVERLSGMFAFALWDGPAERLLLARDPYGKKPLFLARRGADLYFASEIKGLRVLPGIGDSIDESALPAYLAYRYVPGPATLFRGIAKLPPGTRAVWQGGLVSTERYFEPADSHPPVGGEARDARGAIEGFRERFDAAVAARLVSDVPFGAFLSGGIDSTAVVGAMSRALNRPVDTFSVGFAEHALSELPHAEAVARAFGTNHHPLVIRPADIVENLAAATHFRDAPVTEPSDVPIHLMSLAAARRVKMVLTGEGADEFLAGYPKHLFERWGAVYRLVAPPVLRAGLERAVEALPYRFRRARIALGTLGLDDPRQRYPRWFGLPAAGLIEPGAAAPFPPGEEVQRPFGGDPRGGALRALLHFDQTSWLPDNLLERGDRMTMGASIEARMPFMDLELTRFVAGLPDRFRLRGRTTKWVLRRAMRGRIPQAILDRPKIGFRIPVGDWFRGEMRDYLLDHLGPPQARLRDLVRPAALDALLAEHDSGRRDHDKSLWALLGLEVFLRQAAAASARRHVA